jgi:acyl carrier protein
MTDRTQMTARVREIVAEVLDLPANQVADDLSSGNSSAWTSLNHLMLVSQLENEFGVVFSNQEVRALSSVGAILETLGRRLDSVG